MAGYQNTIIIGNVGNDPELRFTQSGVAVCNFSVAVTRRWKDRNTNEQREETTWFRVSTWRGLAETCNVYVHKGMQIAVSGTITASAYLANDATPRASLDLRANNVIFLGKRNGGDGDDDNSAKPPPIKEHFEPGDLPF